MVAEDVVARHALGNGVILHNLHLVVRHGAVVTAHDELRRHTFLVERDAVVQPIPQDARRRAVGEHGCAQHNDRVGIEADRRLRLDDTIFGRGDGRHVLAANTATTTSMHPSIKPSIVFNIHVLASRHKRR